MRAKTVWLSNGATAAIPSSEIPWLPSWTFSFVSNLDSLIHGGAVTAFLPLSVLILVSTCYPAIYPQFQSNLVRCLHATVHPFRRMTIYPVYPWT